MKRYIALLPIMALLLAAPANAAPPVKIRTAHRMAERWANHPEPTHHETPRCWRRSRQVVKCRIHYHEAGVFEFDENGTWVPAGGEWREIVTVRRRKHWLVLTSETFTGQQKQRS
jgi:hypothetical protein